MEASRRDPLPLLLLGLSAVVLVWSAVAPHDRFTWFLEVAPALIGAAVLALTFRRFRLSSLSYVLLALHAAILMLGGKYTYAEVPLGFWMQEWFGFTRNHYDRIGHFAQGFVPAIVAREVLLRRTPLQRGGWLFYLVVSVCLAISAAYELVEWSVAELTGTAADAFLGSQGDVWDTQKDMAMAGVGAVAALLLLSRLHDRSLRRAGVATAPELVAASRP